MNKNIGHKITYIPFLFTLSFFIVNQIVAIIPDKADMENRTHIEYPEFNVRHLDYFPKKFDEYFTDNFSLRNRFLSSYNHINSNIFKNYIVSKYIIQGKDDYKFIVSRYKKNSEYFTELDMDLIKKELEHRDSIFKSQGRKLFLFIIPEKNSTCNNELPYIFKWTKPNRTEHLMSFLHKKSNVKIFYINDFLKEKHQSKSVFLKYDTHWNNYGAFCSYLFIAEKLKKYYPAISIHNMNDYEIKDTVKAYGDVQKNLGMEKIDIQYEFSPKFEIAQPIQPKTTYPMPGGINYGQLDFLYNRPNLPKAFVIRDSFTIMGQQFYRNLFNRSVFVWDNWKYLPHYDAVNDYDPEIVVYIMVEGNLEQFLPEERMKIYATP